ncbi:MAG: hypothetical protein B7Y96_02270, partial [Comamonadaceae bacterium 32-67-11]
PNDPDTTLRLVAIQDLSVQHATQQRLEHLLAELRATLESTADGILVCDLDGRIRAFNRLFAQLWDLPNTLLTQQNDESIHRWLASRVTDPEGYRLQLGLLQRSPLLQTTDVLLLQNGRLLERITRPQLARGRPIGRIYAFRDITERYATESQLKLAAKVFESSLDAILITDPQQRILACNPATLSLTRTQESDLLGTPATSLFFAPSQIDWLEILRQHLEGAGYWQGELWHRRADGAALALQVSWVVLREHRRAHRPAQPPDPDRTRRARDPAGAAQWFGLCRVVPRPGPLQKHQRLARAPVWRQGADRDRQPAQALSAPDRHPVPPWRRRVRRPPA